VITAAKLKSRTVKDLAEMARKKGVPGWHAMRKDQLIRALARCVKVLAAKRPNTNGNGNGKKAAKPRSANGKAAAAKLVHKNRSPRMQRRLEEIKAKLAQSKNLSFKSVAEGNGHRRDRLVVMVRDPYWLHAYWELSGRGIERARAAMGQHWHAARPVLRLEEVTRNGTTTSASRVVRDIAIHGGVNNWYVDVQNPPKSYQLEIGYASTEGKFFALARSNVVSTPHAGAGCAFDKNWADVAKDFDRIYAMSGGYVEQDTSRELKEVFEEHLRRPMGGAAVTQFGPGASAGRHREFNFRLDTELIVHGVAEPGAHVTLRGEPIHLRPDGTFAVRFNLPDRRHVLPVVARSCDGVEQRTIVLAVDRNMKVMEPLIHDHSE
jgi:uncharacterized protein